MKCIKSPYVAPQCIGINSFLMQTLHPFRSMLLELPRLFDFTEDYKIISFALYKIGNVEIVVYNLKASLVSSSLILSIGAKLSKKIWTNKRM